MKRYEVLKTVVILQAVCMIALTGMVMVKVWPFPAIRDNDHNAEKPGGGSHDGDSGLWNGDESEAVASIGGVSISKGQLLQELLRQHGDAALRVIMVRKAIDLEAKDLGLEVTHLELDRELAASVEGYESEERFFAVMKEQVGLTRSQVLDEMRYRLLMEKIAAHTVLVSDEEVDRYLEENPGQLGPRLQLHLQWIVTSTIEQAEDLLQKLENGDDFAELAKQFSIDEFTAESGGDLGLIDADDPFYDELVLSTAKGMDIAEIVGPIAIDQGYAILELIGRKTTSGLTGQLLLEGLRMKLALEKAGPIEDAEDRLLKKYGALILK
ncbi:peptidylprolyl isomerase [Paenibacillus sp. GCM10027627]|uniref:peptidylprolyl isomerase n=1 Tax=unclassified Paenibacillus TaxID=185978 RepID=UPI00362DCEB7